jgi:L-histidine N-alpha-methyltransferase
MTGHRAGVAAAVRDPTDRLASEPDRARWAFAESAAYYLQQTPRQLPSRFLYDALGSALFDAICHLPWYGITRAERRLLERHAGAIGRVVGPRGRLVELGCGNGEKLATLLTHAGVPGARAHLIDLSATALAHAAQALDALGWPEARVTTHHATYEEGLLALPADATGTTVVAFLGSSIGNFDPPGAAALLRLTRAALRPGDALLLGADLVKPERDLRLAYDDPLGLTAAFNKNLLQRLNTELAANIVLDRFAHRAAWNRAASRVEMHLVSLTAQDVVVPGAGLRVRLDAGETIWTESSYKYELDDLRRLIEPAAFVLRQQWIDEPARFALTLFEAA